MTNLDAKVDALKRKRFQGKIILNFDGKGNDPDIRLGDIGKEQSKILIESLISRAEPLENYAKTK